MNKYESSVNAKYTFSIGGWKIRKCRIGSWFYGLYDVRLLVSVTISYNKRSTVYNLMVLVWANEWSNYSSPFIIVQSKGMGLRYIVCSMQFLRA